MSEASLLAGAEFETGRCEFAGVYRNTLGLLAVKAVTDDDRFFQIAGVREQLADMPHYQAERFSELCDGAVPDDLRADKAANYPHALWGQWLIRGASDRQLMDFLKWNVEMTWQQQSDDRFQSIIETEKEAFKEGVEVGIHGGWLHPDFEIAIDGVDDLEVYVGDMFNADSKGYSGFHIRGTRNIVIAGSKGFQDGFEDLYSRIPWVAPHEFHHPFGRLKDRWADEAMTEHHAQVSRYGQPHIIRPDARRHNYNQAYASERTLMADVTLPVSDPLPANLVSQAYSQIYGDDRLEELVERFDKRWGVYAPPGESAFTRFNKRINSLELDYQFKGLPRLASGDMAATRIRNMLARDPKTLFSADDTDKRFKHLLQ